MRKRKATKEPELPVLTVDSVYDDAFPTDLFIRVGGYWTGKEYSSYLSAAVASKELREGSHHLAETSEGILQCLTKRCSDFLDSIGALDSMRDLFREKSASVASALRDLDAPRPTVRPVSEWCAFLDYCETSGLRLSKSRLEQDDPIHPIWIVGAGTFGASESPSILSVPAKTWRPGLLYLGEKWMVDFPKRHPRLRNAFPLASLAIPQMMQNIDSTVAILSWKDSKYLALMHQAYDIAAGMLVYHEYDGDPEASSEGSYLNWMSQQWCQMYPIRNALGQLEKLKWLLKGTEWDNNMLASVEINDANIPHDHMEKFNERIVRLMKEAQKLYKEETGKSKSESDSC